MSLRYWLASAENRHHANQEVEYHARISETPNHPAQGRLWEEVRSYERGTHGLFEQHKEGK